MGIESSHPKKAAPTAEEYMHIEKSISSQQDSLATAEIGDMDSTLEKIDSLEEARVEAYESGRAEAEIENKRIDDQKATQEAQRVAKIDEAITATRAQFKTGTISREKLGELVAQLKVLEAEKSTTPKTTTQESASAPQEETRVAAQTEETSMESAAVNAPEEPRIDHGDPILNTEAATTERDPVYEEKKTELLRRYGAINLGTLNTLDRFIDDAEYDHNTHKPQYAKWVEARDQIRSELKKVEQEYVALTGRHVAVLAVEHKDWQQKGGS